MKKGGGFTAAGSPGIVFFLALLSQGAESVLQPVPENEIQWKAAELLEAL